MRNYLSHKSVAIMHRLTAAMAETFKTEDEDKLRAKVRYLLDNLLINWSDLPPQVADILKPFAEGAAADALDQIEVTLKVAVDLANDRAAEWAKERSAEMVGMKWIDGRLEDNPDAEWSIDQSTRDMVAELVTQAIEEGWSNDRLASEIGDSDAFSDSRAEMIARTETAMADVQGNMAAYGAAQEAGIELLKEWLTVGDDAVSDDCQANEDAGPIPLDDAFPSGADAPPEHPNCRCDVLPITLHFGADETETETEN